MTDYLRESTYGIWNEAMRRAVEQEMLRREKIHGLAPDRNRMKNKMQMLIEFDSKMRSEGLNLTIEKLLDQLGKLEHRHLIRQQMLEIRKEERTKKLFLVAFVIMAFFSVFFSYF